MANEFKPWIDDENVSNSNVQPGVTFIADSQRKNGFEAGQPASSIRVNTALREATLVATALVNLLGQSADLFSAQTSLTDMQTAFASYFGQDVVGVSYNASNNTLTINFKNGGSQMVPLPSPEDATTWYEGTDVAYVSEGDYYAISKSSYPTIKINDLYLITETYTSGDQEIKVGDIFKVIDQNPASVEVQKQLNIAGPQGADGQPGQPGQDGEDGSVWYHGSDLEINQSNDPWWDERSWPSGADVKEHDYYLVTATLSPFNEGDVYEVIDIGPGGAIMQFVLNIKGASGGGGASIGGGFLLDCSCSTGMYTGTWEALILGSYSGTYGWHHVSQDGTDMDTIIDGTAIGSLDFSMTNVSLIVFKTAPSGGDFDEITGTMYCDGVALSKANVTQYTHKLVHLESDVYLSWED